MKKIFPLLLIAICTCSIAAAQGTGNAKDLPVTSAGKILSAQKENDLVVLGKVWGFLKYFHPQIAAGKVDWDKALTDFIPGYLNAPGKEAKSDTLLAWINGIGNVPSKKAGNYDTIKNAVQKPDFSWISTKHFSAPLVSRLKYILENRAQGDQYYTKFHSIEGLNVPEFTHEKGYPSPACPPADMRLIALFRFWNVIEYWYPYKYSLRESWNNVLKENIRVFLAADTPEKYTRAIQQLTASLQDGHGFVRSKYAEEMAGYYYMPFTISCVQNKFIIGAVTNDTAAANAGIVRGDIIEAIDGVSMSKIVKARLPYVYASTTAYAKSSLAYDLSRTTKPVTTLTITHGGIEKMIQVSNELTKRLRKNAPALSLQRDTAFCMFKNNIAYLNMGVLKAKDSLLFKDLINRSDALIIDTRQNLIENGEARNPFGIIAEMLREGPPVNTFTTQQPDFAGVFKFLDAEYIPQIKTVYHYKKPIAVLINEGVISAGESMAMEFSKAYNAVLIGSHTSGTDGMNSFLLLPGNVLTGFTGTGYYWADGKENQRIGVSPQIKVLPTIKGYTADRDEVTEKAIEYLSAIK